MYTVETTSRFDDELQAILDFIAIGSPYHALKFFDHIMEALSNIPDNPYQYRQRADDPAVRELITKGYTIPLFIDESRQTIFVLGIFNQNFWE